MEERARLPYAWGLDGLRGVSVLLVLAFHGGVPGFRGGFLGVSVFFTLSGYLITQLLLREHERTGAISLGAFWTRRLRRLVPASMAALLAVGLIALVTDMFSGQDVPGDVVAASLDVANWRFAMATTTYSDLFQSSPSPVLHFWSLAIEEQFYLLFPLVIVGVLARGGRRWVPAVLVVLAVAGTVGSLLAPDDLAYYATFARAPELLAGALLALVLPLGQAPSGRWRVGTLAGGGVLAAALVALAVATSDPTSPWLYRGGLPAFSLLSVAIIAALAVPGPVRFVGERRTLVALGAISYGVYVYHWPIFLVLSEERLGFGGPALLSLRLVATLGVAILSATLLEGPLRRGVVVRRPARAGALLAGSLAIVIALALAIAPPTVESLVPERVDGEVAVRFSSARPTLDVLVVGSLDELDDWVRDAPVVSVDLRVRSAVQPGCPIVLPDRDNGRCLAFSAVTTAPAPAPAPDLVVLGLGPADRFELQDEARRMESDDEVLDATREALVVGEQLVQTRLAALPAAPVLVVDTGPDDVLARQLRAVDLRVATMTLTRPDRHETFDHELQRLLSSPSIARTRVLVVGDSTSAHLAAALDGVGRDRLEVVWAGFQNCPLASAERIRWWPGNEFDVTACPGPATGWATAVETFHPDVVVATASLPALSEQMYEPGGAWRAPGTDDYVAAHDRSMEKLQQLLAVEGAVTVVATTPPLLQGEAFDGPVGDPDRLAAWTAQLQRWDEHWASVGVLDWGTIVTSAEAAAGRHLRVDAIHFDRQALMEILGPRLVDELLAALERVAVDVRSVGCRPDGEPRHLVLDRCRVAL